jgi:hypothetical protein
MPSLSEFFAQMGVTAQSEIGPIVGRWQGTSNQGFYSDIVFTPDGTFSAILNYGAMQRIGRYRMIDAQTIHVVDDPGLQVQFLPGSYGQPVARIIQMFPEETNFVEFPDPQTMVMRSSTAPVFTRYTRAG